MEKNIILKGLLEDYGLSVSIKEGSYVKGKIKYWFDIKVFDQEKDQLYMRRATTRDKNFITYYFLRTHYSIITNMNELDIGMFKVQIDELMNNPDKWN